MSQPQTVSAILVALTAYREAAMELGRLINLVDIPKVPAAQVKLLKAETNLLRATLAYGRRFEDPNQPERPMFESWNLPQVPK